MSSPSFWDDQDEARKVSSEVNRLKQIVEKLETFKSKVDDLVALAELVDEAGDEGDGCARLSSSPEVSGLARWTRW